MSSIFKAAFLTFVLSGFAAAQMTGSICYDVGFDRIGVTLDSVPACEGTITVKAEVVGSGVPVDITGWFTGQDITPPSMYGRGAFTGGPWFCGLNVKITVICTTGGSSSESSTTATINCNC